jgi:protoheme ferro-lyase
MVASKRMNKEEAGEAAQWQSTEPHRPWFKPSTKKKKNYLGKNLTKEVKGFY